MLHRNISQIELIVSVCLIIIFSMFFATVLIVLIASWIFSILFSRLWNIFIVIILNCFPGSFPISSLFTWSCVFLVCYFICAILLCLFSFFLNIVFGISFSQSLRLKSIFFWFLLLVGRVDPVVCVDFYWVWFVLVLWWEEVLYLFIYVLPAGVRNIWGGNPVCRWLGLCFCFICC